MKLISKYMSEFTPRYSSEFLRELDKQHERALNSINE